MPVFETSFKQRRQENVLKKCDENCIDVLKREYKINSEKDLLKVLEDFTNKVMKSYNILKLPNQYPYDNIIGVQGEPFYGMIVFKLTDKSSVYFVSNTKIFNTIHLPSNTNKFDDYWYYRIK